MKKFTVAALIICLTLVIFVYVVNAAEENPTITDVDLGIPDPKELPELDMTGMHTDIELIEVDPEIMSATKDWIVLAHDDAGKKALIEDIDRSSLSMTEKNDMKSAVKDLWNTYPTKFVDAGQKNIEIYTQSDRSNSIKSIPIGHVTRITFDRQKIKQVAQSKTASEAKRLIAFSTPATHIVLTEAENQTVKNITSIRSKQLTDDKASSSQQIKSRGSARALSSGSSFSASSTITSGISSSSDFTRETGFSSSLIENSGYSGTGLLAWSGSWVPPPNPDSDPVLATGHYSFIYWACKNMNYPHSAEAASHSIDPDIWSVLNPPIILPFHQMFLIPVPDFVPFYNTIVHSYDHYWNPDRRTFDLIDQNAGNAPYIADDYALISKQKYAQNPDDPNAAKTLGWASHFLSDVSNPMHTGKELEQIWDNQFTPYDTHSKYEGYMEYYSTHPLPYGLDPSGDDYTYNTLIKNDEKIFYRVTSPETATKNLAIFSHSYLNTLYYKVQNLPPETNSDGSTIHGTNFEGDYTVQRITDNCVIAAARYNAGLVNYAMNLDPTSEIPVADFSANPNPVCGSDYTVSFYDKTHTTYKNSADPMHLIWYFGDGSTRTGDFYPVHQYLASDYYKVRLETWNSIGRTNKTMYVIIDKCAPSADFSISSPAPYVISVFDLSLYSPTEWRWDFGDGTISTDPYPILHTYSELREYNVKLTASNEYGSGTKSVTIIPLPPAPVVYAWANKKTGIAPLSVQFSDRSIGYVSSREWDFGDNTSVSTEQNVTHEYTQPGTYIARLTVNGIGTDTNTTEITVFTPPTTASFTASPTSGYKPLTVQFNDTSSYSPTNWSWNFGDGTTSSEQNPLHTYSTAGNYTVNLTATNAGGSDSLVRESYITVLHRSLVSAGSVYVGQPGNETTLLLTMDSAPEGLGGFNLNLTFSNQYVAQVTAVSFPDWASSMNYNSPLPAGQDLVVKASDVNSLIEAGAINIELANITVLGLAPGQTELLISRTNFDDDAGYDIPHVTVNGNVTVGD